MPLFPVIQKIAENNESIGFTVLTEDARYDPNLPDKDFGGVDFTFAVRGEKPAQAIAMPIYKFNNHNSNMSVEKDFYLGTLFIFKFKEIYIEIL